MFKKYRFEWEEEDGKRSIDFFVHSKKTRNGFLHRACALGPVPRLDETSNDWASYRANDEKLVAKRVAKVPYCNRTWESYGGQTCLSRIWSQLSKLKFTDMARICKSNPFDGPEEPEHEDLWEPDELFEGFSR